MAEFQSRHNNNQHENCNVPPPPPASYSAQAPVTTAAKRLRKPSVRLGEIGGDQYLQHHVAYDSYTPKPKWTQMGNKKDMSISSRTRTLNNLSCGYANSVGNVESFGVGSFRVKKRVGSSISRTTATKRFRSNWVSKTGEFHHGDEKISGGEESEDGYKDFSREESESPIKEEALAKDGGFYSRRRYKSNNSSGNMEFEISKPSNLDGGGKESVKIWLQELGLGRYWPMFEIHEVDEEALPLLTLDDLKDIGINAVGLRRKVFCAIQKLSREFS